VCFPPSRYHPRSLPLFALVCLWAANPRGLLLYLLLNAGSIVFDVAYLGAQGSGAYVGGRPGAAVGEPLRCRRRLSLSLCRRADGLRASPHPGPFIPRFSAAFVIMNLLLKAVIVYFTYLEFLRIGGTFSRDCATTSSTMSSGGGGGGGGVVLASPLMEGAGGFNSAGLSEEPEYPSPRDDAVPPKSGGYQS
jgi:hypothetical protein